MIRALPVFLLLLLIPALSRAGTADAKGQFLIGNWYGERQPEDPNVFWLARFWPNGRFEAMFRTCARKQTLDEHDEGTWNYAGGITEVTSRRVNGQTILQIERYRTLSYDGRKHVYQHLRSGFVFTAIRVGSDYELPSCSLSS